MKQGIHSVFLSGVLVLMPPLGAQEISEAQQPTRVPSQHEQAVQSAGERPHSFWDATNVALFVGVGGVRALDYASTRHFRNRGVDEWLLTNAIVDNKPLFAGLEVGGTLASVGVAYLLHRSGHHKLERWISIIHIGAGIAGSAHNYSLERTPATAPPL